MKTKQYFQVRNFGDKGNIFLTFKQSFICRQFVALTGENNICSDYTNRQGRDKTLN